MQVAGTWLAWSTTYLSDNFGRRVTWLALGLMEEMVPRPHIAGDH